VNAADALARPLTMRADNPYSFRRLSPQPSGVQQRRRQTVAFGGIQRQSANSDRDFWTGCSDLSTARFGVRISVPEPLSKFANVEYALTFAAAATSLGELTAV